MTDSTEWIVSESIAFRIRFSGGEVRIEDHSIPEVIEVSFNGKANGGPDPETYARVEVNPNGRPRLAELRFLADDPEGQGIRQADLRGVEVGKLVGDLVARYTLRFDRGEDSDTDEAVTSLDDLPGLTRFIDRKRAGRTTRDITPELLERVANVYRDNIAKYPTKSVQSHFQVSQRMAAEYVSRARKRGLLPPTKKGKKNA